MSAEQGDVEAIRKLIDGWYSGGWSPRKDQRDDAYTRLDRLAAALDRVERERDAANTYYEAAKEVAIDLRRERDEAWDYTARAAVGNIDRARMPLPARYWLDSVARAEKAERALVEIADDPRTPFTVGDIARAALRPSEEASDES